MQGEISVTKPLLIGPVQTHKYDSTQSMDIPCTTKYQCEVRILPKVYKMTHVVIDLERKDLDNMF